MKKFRICSVLTVTALLFICATAALAQKAGGYRETSKDDPAVMAAANFAIEARAEKTGATIELVSIERAESQVVAGTNFRLCLKVSTSGDGGDANARESIRAVVFQNLKGGFSLTSWVRKECGEQ